MALVPTQPAHPPWWVVLRPSIVPPVPRHPIWDFRRTGIEDGCHVLGPYDQDPIAGSDRLLGICERWVDEWAPFVAPLHSLAGAPPPPTSPHTHPSPGVG